MSNNLLVPKKKPATNRVPNTVTLISVANRRDRTNADIQIDVSFMESLFEHVASGLDAYIQGTLYGLYEDFLNKTVDLIESIGVERGLVVVISSDGGEKRAVAVVELLAQELKSARINTLTYHKELDKWSRF